MQLMNFKDANCKNCYKCVRACPVKAIKFSDHQAIIDDERCIACGQCFLACPQNARNVLSDIDKVMNAFKKDLNMIALIAPSFAGFYKNKGGFIRGLQLLGFDKVIEVSAGAEEVTRLYGEYMEMEKPKYGISSCCPTVNLLIRRYYKGVANYLLPVVSPMIATGKAVKNQDRDCFAVFISPCLSKKCEPLMYNNEGIIDAVLTMEEINQIFFEYCISVEQMEPKEPTTWGELRGKSYPLKGGISEGFKEILDKEGYDILHVEGILEVKEILNEMEKGLLSKTFIELNACNESCISGPCIPKNTYGTFLRKQLVKKHAYTGWEGASSPLIFKDLDLGYTYRENLLKKEDFRETDIEKTLARMGKTKETDELDCSACGYDNCREKARAVLEGMSDVEMCMPFMRTRAEHMNDIIFYNSPNMIFILDESLTILQMNPSAEMVFKHKAMEVKHFPISYLIKDDEYKRVMNTKENSINKRVVHEDFDLVVMESIIYLPKDNQILAIMSDITMDEKRRKELLLMKENTVDITNKVIEKQMRVAHEIASLLGETTAETKIALNQLKAIVMEER